MVNGVNTLVKTGVAIVAGEDKDKALAALETTSLGLRIQAPAAVLSSGGGSLSGTELRVALPVMELLVLEKPVEFWLRWKR